MHQTRLVSSCLLRGGAARSKPIRTVFVLWDWGMVNLT